MPEITLRDMLAAKERRSLARQRMLAEHPGPCVSLVLNMPGQEKLSPRVSALFRYAVGRILERFRVRAMTSVTEPAGPYAIFSVEPGEPGRPGESGAAELKEAARGIESEGSYGRLLDLDVYDAQGGTVFAPGRENGRPCFICPLPSAVCRRAGNHSDEALRAAVDAMFVDFYAATSRSVSPRAETLAALALEALLFEAAACPSPGLVDPLHTGSHRDMDFFTFLQSSAALAHGLARCAEAGLRHESGPEDLLPVLRRIGREAECEMLRATGGVNTHKGALFLMGLALGAAALAVRQGKKPEPETVCRELARMTAGITEREMGFAKPVTAGEHAYRNFGITGIRGEVERGLPSVRSAGLPALKAALAANRAANGAANGTANKSGGNKAARGDKPLVRALLALMAVTDDTGIIRRAGSLEALRSVQDQARRILDSGLLEGGEWQKAVWDLDAELTARNLSPGGAADLLAVTWFLHRIGETGAA